MQTATLKISDFGIRIGGAKKDRMDNSKTVSKEKKESLPFWVPRSMCICTVDDVKEYSLEERRKKGNGIICLAEDRRCGKMAIAWGYNSKDELLDDLPSLLVPYLVSIYKSKNGLVLGKKIKTTGKLIELVSGFNTQDEAIAYRSEHALELLEYKVQFPELPHLKTICRTGKDYRNGENITTEKLCATFGFPGIEFGNWLTQKERQMVLNLAYEAFFDLADVTGLPPMAMSLNGNLAAAFGSRGAGNELAHFEPERFVFNLCRIKGAGSLAHEWFHALEHYILHLFQGQKMKRQADGKVVFVQSDMDSKIYDNLIHAYDKLKGLIQYKKTIIPAGTKEKLEVWEKNRDLMSKRLSYHEDVILNELKKNKPYRKKFGKPAPDEYIQKVKELMNEIRNGNLGESCIHPNRAKYNDIPYKSNEKAELIGKILKKTRNSDYFGENKMMSEYLLTINKRSLYEKKMEDEKRKMEAGILEEKKIKTDYFNNAGIMDSFRSSMYWSMTNELLARAFGAFVQDKIEQKGNVSNYLVHSHCNDLNSKFKAYPEAEERIAFNGLFEDLFCEARKVI
ncbi:LPD1 domain-containing protein [Parabacteroides merdae]|jgi:hypothetical protein|uniref:LPD1 domain-containing protein n=1 Tax=Parabacteroides merdae TaxID=46503 RepID=UPI0034A59CF8